MQAFGLNKAELRVYIISLSSVQRDPDQPGAGVYQRGVASYDSSGHQDHTSGPCQGAGAGGSLTIHLVMCESGEWEYSRHVHLIREPPNCSLSLSLTDI